MHLSQIEISAACQTAAFKSHYCSLPMILLPLETQGQSAPESYCLGATNTFQMWSSCDEAEHEQYFESCSMQEASELADCESQQKVKVSSP